VGGGLLCCRPHVQPTSTSGTARIGWLNAALRVQRVALVLAKHGFGGVLESVGLLVPGMPNATPAPSSRERLARRLADALTELGPTYIKLGQLLATRADLFPPEVVQALSTLHAEVRSLPFTQVAKLLERELGELHKQAFASFDQRCLAAASIGQVHRARLRDGSEVVVKIQRPGLRAQLEADLSIMRMLATLLAQQVPEVAAYRPVALVDAFARSLDQELDFRNEAENARKLRTALRGAPEVHVPHVYEAWTTERVLVMEYVAGTKLVDLAPAARGPARQALLRAFVRQMLEHGVFHADPHPGNLLALGDGRVALLDLGSIDVLDGKLRAGLFRLGFALLLRHQRALCNEVIGLAHTDDAARIDRARLRGDLEALLRSASRGQGSAVIGQMLSVSRAHALRLPGPLLALMRALAILDGVVRKLDPAADLVRDLRREVAWAALRRVRYTLASPLRWVVQVIARVARRSPARRN
jgi:ubiquinone biosynthesis protein